MEDNIIEIYDGNENKKLYKIIAFYDNKYIIYKDIDNPSNDKNLYASKVISQAPVVRLEALNDEEWDIIEKAYNNILES